MKTQIHILLTLAIALSGFAAAADTTNNAQFNQIIEQNYADQATQYRQLKAHLEMTGLSDEDMGGDSIAVRPAERTVASFAEAVVASQPAGTDSMTVQLLPK